MSSEKRRYIFPLLLMFLSFSFVSLLTLNTSATYSNFFLTGGGGQPTEVVQKTYTTPGVYKTVKQYYSGASLDSASWLNPSYLSVGVSGHSTYLQILPYEEYLTNNASLTPDNCNIAINMTFEIPSGYSPYGQLLVAYGVNVGPNLCPPHFYPAGDGIAVIFEKGNAGGLRLITEMNGVVINNVSTGTFNLGENYTMGFLYVPATSLVATYWFNGTWHCWVSGDLVSTADVYGDAPLKSNGNYFVIGAQNSGLGYGNAQWVIVNYSVYQKVVVTPPMSITVSYRATTLANGLEALTSYVGAYNPINVTVNATSWEVLSYSVSNYSISGSVYGISGQVKDLVSSDQILLYFSGIYPSISTDTWYLNVSFSMQLVTSGSSSQISFKVPLYVAGFAQEAYVSYPYSSYLSGQIVDLNDSIENIFPPGEGYTIQSPLDVEIDIQGITTGYVSYPYSTTPQVTVPSTFNYVITAEEDGLVVKTFTSSFNVDPVQNYPVIFSVYPQTAIYGLSFTLKFQFSENGPISNVTSFSESAGLLEFSYLKMEASQVTLILSIPQTKYGSLVFIPASGNNYYLPLNGSGGIQFSPGENVLNLQVVNNATEVVQGPNIEVVSDQEPIVGIGIYNATMNWLYLDGAVLQDALSGQSYVISIGQSVSTLQQITTGYTNATGWGVVKVPVEYQGYELVNIYWYGMRNELINISVASLIPTNTSTSSNVTCPSYNYTEPFSSPGNISATSTLYNFSKYQPWATLIGLLIIVLLALMGWKFGGTAGASGGGVAGIVMASYLGLVPWYLYFVVILVIAMLLGKIISDKFLGGGENG